MKGGGNMENVNKEMLVDALANATGLSKKDVAAVIEAFTDQVTESLKKGKKVTLTGFGVFKTSARAAREGRNPQTGEAIKIPAMTVPKFTAGKSLKEAVK